MKKEAVVEIRLKSDLCMGSGYSYAGMIDSDICYDANGIPYIPAKRLKGCFRDTAENVLYSIVDEDVLNSIFGKAGANAVSGIYLDNAYIKDYDAIRAELGKFRLESNNAVSEQDILNQFSHIKAQTKLENGAAKDTSLRYTRVANQYSPLGEKGELVFCAKIIYDSGYERQLSDIIRATRNVGLHRNRGLGSVRCKFPIDAHDIEEADRVLPDSEDRPVVISYVLENIQALMLSSNRDTKSDKFISGKSILGFLAGKYLGMQGTNAEDEAFKDLFLRGGTIFTNAYPYKRITKGTKEEQSGRVYYPAPEYINQLKKTKKLVNTHFGYSDEEEAYVQEQGNIPKKLKDKFVSREDGKIDIMDVDMQIIYHHSEKAKSKNDQNGQLFALTAVKEHQQFAGQVYVKQKYAGLIEKMLHSGMVTLGKSRSSQYGRCILKQSNLSPLEEARKAFQKDQYILVTFLSDAIFMNDYAEYTVYRDEVKAIAAKQLGLSQCVQEDSYSDMIQTKEIVGYNSKWNLRKAPIPALKAGSCFVYKLQQDVWITTDFIGERNLEGYGQVSVESMENMGYALEEVSRVDAGNAASEPEITGLVKTKELVRDILINKIIEQLKLKGITENTYKITASNLGRVTLMLRESLDAHKDSYKEAFADFSKRAESIKTDSFKKEIRTVILGQFGACRRAEDNSPWEYTWEFKGIKDTECGKELRELLKKIGCEESEIKECVDANWAEVLMTRLVSQKYAMKGAQKDEQNRKKENL